MNKIDESHKTRIGCSRLAQALGVSRWGTPYSLWEQYTGRADWPNIGNELRVALGEPMEDVLRPFVSARLGRELRRDRKEYVHANLPIVGHVDYRASALHDEPRPVVDMKTSLGFRAKDRFGDGDDAVDADVLLQMQGYLLLTGAQTAYVAALIPGPELRIYTISSDSELHGMIEEGVDRFWRCVITDTPPDITALEDAARRWPVSLGGQTEALIEQRNAIRELRDLKAQIKALESEMDARELALKMTMADRYDTLLDPDTHKPLCTWKTQERTGVDSARLKAERPEIYTEFSKTTTIRIFRLAKEK